MKPIFCKECKWNKNGWCYKYECNGPKRVEVCPKYRKEDLKVGCEYCNVKYGKEKLITQGCYNNLYIDKDECLSNMFDEYLEFKSNTKKLEIEKVSRKAEMG